MERVLKKQAGGRPPKYATAAALQARIDAYFTDLQDQRHRDPLMATPPTITGLVLACGFCNRASFYDLERVPMFSNIIKGARTRIEAIYEARLHGNNPTGAIFALKNFGWSDRQEIAHSGVVTLEELVAGSHTDAGHRVDLQRN